MRTHETASFVWYIDVKYLDPSMLNKYQIADRIRNLLLQSAQNEGENIIDEIMEHIYTISLHGDDSEDFPTLRHVNRQLLTGATSIQWHYDGFYDPGPELYTQSIQHRGHVSFQLPVPPDIPVAVFQTELQDAFLYLCTEWAISGRGLLEKYFLDVSLSELDTDLDE